MVEAPRLKSGMGGIQSGRDAAGFLAAGATAVAVGTESFRDPAAGERVRDELAMLLARHGTARVRDAVGVPFGRRKSASNAGQK